MPLVAEIVISHGYFIDAMTRIFDSKHKSWSSYCAVTSYRFDVKDDGEIEEQVLLKSNADHIPKTI